MPSAPPRHGFDLDAAFGPNGLLANAMPGYEHRASQLQMARAVEQALLRDEMLLVEAGTGTGKTLAYLLPALLSGRKVVIATGTKTLQDQLIEHDLPLLTQQLGIVPSVACMKGLANYLCLRRYDEWRHSSEAVTSRKARQLSMLETWAERTTTGDRAELDLPDDSTLWAEVQSGSDTRIGPKCQHYDACHVTRMRKNAEAAQLVIVNHHLFFADLALRGNHPGGAIPDYDAVIFDEAHLIEDVATEFFGVSVSSAKLQVLLRDAGRVLAANGLVRESETWLVQVADASATFFATLPRVTGTEGGRLALSPDAWGDRLSAPMFALDNALDGLASLCKRQAEASEAVVQIARRADQIRNDVATIAEGGGSGRVSYTQARGRSVSLGASPIDVADILRERLFMRRGAVVMTSATLSLVGSKPAGAGEATASFAFLRSRLGIDMPPTELVLPSPFDFPTQAALYVPEHFPDPREAAYPARAEQEIAALITLTDGGAFVLCTSHRMMRALHERLMPTMKRLVLLQGDAPNAALLERFRNDGHAVLFATSSFWQGVDVPGRALRLVIIDKLPFDVPTDPLIAARCDRLREQGEEPFMKYLVPAAALALKQGFGRLIRTRRDRGVVAVLDSRLVRKGYGKVLLRSLPPATRCHTLREVSDFWQRVSSDLELADSRGA